MDRLILFLCLIYLAAIVCVSAATPQPVERAQMTEVQWNNAAVKIPGIAHASLWSKFMQVEIGYNVYLPPGYTEGKQRCPTIYFLHGAGGDENSDAGAFSSLIRRAVEEKKIAPLIAVFPNGGMTGYIGQSCAKPACETFFIKELIPQIDAKYRTISARESRAIGGFSMGGGGALGFALKYPELFSAAGTWAASLLNSCPAAVPRYSLLLNGFLEHWAKKNFARINGRLRLLLIVGDKDLTNNEHKLLIKQLNELQLRYEYKVLDGVTHNLALYYEKTGAELIRFLAEGLTPKRPDKNPQPLCAVNSTSSSARKCLRMRGSYVRS